MDRKSAIKLRQQLLGNPDIIFDWRAQAAREGLAWVSDVGGGGAQAQGIVHILLSHVFVGEEDCVEGDG